jgi:hypothetical protein
MVRSPVKRGSFAIGLALLGISRNALAASNAEPQQELADYVMAAAQTACEGQHDVEKGIKILTDYFQRTGELSALYNMGRCYEQNHLDAKAADQFREYLRRNKALKADRRREIEAHIKELETKAATPAAAPSSPQPVLPSAPPAAEPATPLLTPQPVSPAPADHPPGNPVLRTTSYALGGVGVVALGVGVVYGLKVSAVNRDLTKLAQMNGSATAYTKKQDEGRSAQRIEIISLVTGGVALAAGTLCYWMSRSPQAERAMMVGPWLARGGAGATFSMRY